ncbi:MDR family MFS transporter [Chloroflexota bacterium]
MKLSSFLPGPLRRIFSRFDKGIWTLTLVDLINAAGFSTCVPFLSLYLYQERGIAMTLVGTVFLTSGLISAVTQIIGGYLADRYGRKKIIIVSMILNILNNLGMTIMILFSAPILAILPVFVLGRAAGMTSRPALSAMVVDLAEKDRLTETYGLIRVGRNLGWAAGPAIGGYLATFLPYAWLFAAAVLMNTIAFLIILLFLKESQTNTLERIDIRSIFAVVQNKSFVLFTGFCLLVFLCMAHLGSTLSVFTVDRLGFSTAEYGLLLTTNGLIVVLFQYPVALLISRLRKYRVLMFGSLLYMVGWLYMGWTTSFGWAATAMVIVTMGEIIFSPVATATVGEWAPYDKRGRYMGFFGWSETIGMSMAPLVGGILLDRFIDTPNLVWTPIAAFGFVAAIGFFWLGRRNRTDS